MIGKGRISAEELKEVKAMHFGRPLLKFEWPKYDDEIIFRTIDSDTYKYITNLVDANKSSGSRSLPIDEVHQAVFERCVVWPHLTIDEKISLPIGVIPSVSKIIQERSGFLDVDIADRILAPEIYTTLIQPFPTWPEPTKEQIDEIKAHYKFPLFKVRVESCTFILRPMTRTDVRVAGQSMDDRLALTKSVSMWPENVDWENIPAGWVEALGRAASDLSGWDSEAIVSEV